MKTKKKKKNFCERIQIVLTEIRSLPAIFYRRKPFAIEVKGGNKKSSVEPNPESERSENQLNKK